MTTAQNIYDRLAVATKNTDDTVLALNAAIDESWPTFKLTAYAAMAAALDSATFEYSLSALTLLDRALGPAEIWVAPEATATEPVIEVHEWLARFDQSLGAWTVVFSNAVVDAYDGDTWYVRYQYKHPAITAIGDTIYLPADYARYYTQKWYAEVKSFEAPIADAGKWIGLAREYDRLAREALLRHLTPTLASHGVGRDRLG